MDSPRRIGFGSDTHRLELNRPLIIGGQHIPHEKGFVAHSDGDVLIHAIIDAILGALAEHDIGYHFPNEDPSFKDADSMKLLNETLKILNQKNFKLANMDCVIHAEKPKLRAYIPAMKSLLAQTMNVREDQISIKAKTGEAIGFIGRGEGIKAESVVLLYQ